MCGVHRDPWSVPKWAVVAGNSSVIVLEREFPLQRVVTNTGAMLWGKHGSRKEVVSVNTVKQGKTSFSKIQLRKTIWDNGSSSGRCSRSQRNVIWSSLSKTKKKNVGFIATESNTVLSNRILFSLCRLMMQSVGLWWFTRDDNKHLRDSWRGLIGLSSPQTQQYESCVQSVSSSQIPSEQLVILLAVERDIKHPFFSETPSDGRVFAQKYEWWSHFANSCKSQKGNLFSKTLFDWICLALCLCTTGLSFKLPCCLEDFVVVIVVVGDTNLPHPHPTPRHCCAISTPIQRPCFFQS